MVKVVNVNIVWAEMLTTTTLIQIQQIESTKCDETNWKEVAGQSKSKASSSDNGFGPGRREIGRFRPDAEAYTPDVLASSIVQAAVWYLIFAIRRQIDGKAFIEDYIFQSDVVPSGGRLSDRPTISGLADLGDAIIAEAGWAPET